MNAVVSFFGITEFSGYVAGWLKWPMLDLVYTSLNAPSWVVLWVSVRVRWQQPCRCHFDFLLFVEALHGILWLWKLYNEVLFCSPNFSFNIHWGIISYKRSLLQLLIYFCGETRRFLPGCLVLPLLFGCFLNWWNTICSH